MGITFGLAGRLRNRTDRDGGRGGPRGARESVRRADDPALTAAELVDSVMTGHPSDLELVIQAARLVVSTRFATATLLIRRLHVTAQEANSILERLEHCEVVSASDGNRPRCVLTTPAQLPAVIEEFIARG